MSILNHVPSGGLLAKPTGLKTRCQMGPEDFIEKITQGLLPAQEDFVKDSDTLILGLCAGFGAGKTRALCCKVVYDAMHNAGTVMAVFEPTHILLRDVWMRSFDDFLEEMEIEHDFRVSPQPEYVIHTPAGSTTLLCRATETWNRIRGQNLSKIYVDEIDTSPLEVSQKAVEMFLARLRGGHTPQLSMASTPEGYKIMYNLFVEGAENKDRRLIKAKQLTTPISQRVLSIRSTKTMTLLWLPATLMVNLHCYRLSAFTTPSTEIFTGPTSKYPETTAFMYQSILTSEPAFVCLPSDEETNSTLLVKPSPKTHQPLSPSFRRSFPITSLMGIW